MADTYRLLLDENIEHEVLDRLVDAGHNVEHVDTVANLGKGASDTELAAYSVATDRAIVTYDDDFIEEVPPTDYLSARRESRRSGGRESDTLSTYVGWNCSRSHRLKRIEIPPSHRGRTSRTHRRIGVTGAWHSHRHVGS